MKLALPTNIAAYIKTLAKARTAVVGLILIGLFGYTAYIVNAATNVKSDTTTEVKASKIIFDKSALNALKNRNQVPDQTTLGDLGKPDPFAH